VSNAITVAVATCGRPEGVLGCLRALASQSAPPAEVIVVDQDPSETVRSAVSASGLPGVRYLEQPRLGLSASRNLALRSATQPVLAVTDDDCVPDPSWLAAVSDALGRPPQPGAVTGRILPLGDPPPGAYAVSLRESDEPADHALRLMPWAVGSGGNFAAPVDLLRAHGGWDERLGTGSRGRAAEDADLIDRLLASGALIRYEPAAIVRHEWQTRSRRLETRWSYGYGVGAMCGLRLAGRDAHALRMLKGYAGLHVWPLLAGLRRRDRRAIGEHARALGALAPGLLYGVSVTRSER
jgi:GT2 family glycosyltransferase